MAPQSIEQIKIVKLFKELEWIKSDLSYHKKVVENADNEFMKDVDRILNSNEELKELYKKKENEYFIQSENSTNTNTLDEYIDTESSENIIDELEEKVESNEDSTNIKKLYRQIVKLTHPDKVKNKSLNSFYIDATEYYNNNDLFGLCLIAIKLDIDISKQDIDSNKIEELISSEKNKIKFIQSTYSWLWFEADSKQKDKIVLSFIKNKIS